MNYTQKFMIISNWKQTKTQNPRYPLTLKQREDHIYEVHSICFATLLVLFAKKDTKHFMLLNSFKLISDGI